MKKRFLPALLACLLLAVPALCAAQDALLPGEYDAADTRFPVIYLMPQDGAAADGCAFAARLHKAAQDAGFGVIIVPAAFDADKNLQEQLAQITKTTDETFRTIADREHRALVGVGLGGYLAYGLGLGSAEHAAFASICGDFAGGSDALRAQLGSVADRIETTHLKNPGSLDGYYTYMDAAADDPCTDVPGGTGDLGAQFIGYGTGSAAHEFTLREGVCDDAFLDESARRVIDRLAAYTAQEAPQEKTAAETAPAPAVYTTQPACVTNGAFEKLDLSDGWRFFYAGRQALNPAELTEETTADWAVVCPGLGNWEKGYGNISEENVFSGYGADYFNFFITENGYYVRSFALPQGFDSRDLILSVGYVDDRCEVFFNGERIGATGMDENGRPTGDTTWAQYSRFDVPAALIREDGLNTVVVRAYNDLPYGAGGWYGGPVGLYSREAFGAEIGFGAAGEHERFYEETFVSAHAAKMRGEKEPAQNPYLIYLPPSYADSTRSYPTVYLLHQFNSDHTSYKADRIDSLMDAGIAAGAFDEMIVVIPNSDGSSWWKGGWEKMITEELIPAIDEKYRTIRDPRFRLTAGCSMGGQGAMSVALRNPQLFSGAVSFYGAFSYGGADSPNAIAAQESAQYMDAFSLGFICGNQDSYGFGVPALELHRQLDKLGVEHKFFIENGGHDSSFYTPYFSEVLGYVRGGMYSTPQEALTLLSGSLTADGAQLHAEITAGEAAQSLRCSVPASSFGPQADLPLTAGAAILCTVDGRTHTVCRESGWDASAGEALVLSAQIPQGAQDVRLVGYVFDKEMELARLGE